MEPLKILSLEDSQDDFDLVARQLKKSDLGETLIVRCDDGPSYHKNLAERTWDVILCDYRLPDFDAYRALAVRQELSPDTPFIVVSGSIGEDMAVELMKAGATDYVLKDKLAKLSTAISRSLEDRRNRMARLRAETELRQARKLEALGHMAGGIAHDFNNVLAIIISQTELLQEDLNSSAPITLPNGYNLTEGLSEIRRSAEKAANLTRQLLAFSRKQIPQDKILNLNEIVTSVKSMLDRLVKENIQFEVSLTKEIKQIKADPTQVEQVIMNLVVNSRDAMPHGGKIKISTDVIDVPERTAKFHEVIPGAFFRLSVADTGIGMDESVAVRVFEPFFTTKDVGQGTGLGLSTVYGIVRQAGGFLTIDSVVNKGTTFDVFLPVYTSQPNLSEASES